MNLPPELIEEIENQFEQIKSYLTIHWPTTQAAAIAKKELIGAITKVVNELE